MLGQGSGMTALPYRPLLLAAGAAGQQSHPIGVHSWQDAWSKGGQPLVKTLLEEAGQETMTELATLMEERYVRQIRHRACLKKGRSGVVGGIPNKVLYGEAPPRAPHPYPSRHKRYPIHILSVEKCTPLIYLL